MSGESTNDQTRVLVTGASGFIASHLVQQLLRGGYLVRGTVRSLTNPKKVDPIKKLDEEHQRLELVEANLTNEECWKDAVEGCDYVFHTASPFPMTNPRDENDVIKPAVDGTLTVLKACTGKVKRVVLTSSSAAVEFYTSSSGVTEEHWFDESQPGVSAYVKSKKLAERAAWDYVEALSGDQKFELAVVNPGLVIGPVLTNSGGTCIDMICRLMSGKDPAVPKVCFSIVDVRDVARAHIAAMTTPEAAGHRHLLISGLAWFLDINTALKEEFGPQGYSPATRSLPYFVAWAMALFDSAIRVIKKQWNVVVEFDNTRMREVLKIDPIPWKQSVIDMAYSLIETGKIPKKRGYKGRPTTMESATVEPLAAESATGDQQGGDASTKEGKDVAAVDPPATQPGTREEQREEAPTKEGESDAATVDLPATQPDTGDQKEGVASTTEGKESDAASVDPSVAQSDTGEKQEDETATQDEESEAVTENPLVSQPDTGDQEGGASTAVVKDSDAAAVDPPVAQSDTSEKQEDEASTEDGESDTATMDPPVAQPDAGEEQGDGASNPDRQETEQATSEQEATESAPGDLQEGEGSTTKEETDQATVDPPAAEQPEGETL